MSKYIFFISLFFGKLLFCMDDNNNNNYKILFFLPVVAYYSNQNLSNSTAPIPINHLTNNLPVLCFQPQSSNLNFLPVNTPQSMSASRDHTSINTSSTQDPRPSWENNTVQSVRCRLCAEKSRKSYYYLPRSESKPTIIDHLLEKHIKKGKCNLCDWEFYCSNTLEELHNLYVLHAQNHYHNLGAEEYLIATEKVPSKKNN